MVKKAYMLMIHKNPEQVNCLLRQLIKDENSDVYIHINNLNRNIEGMLLKHKNIRVLDETVDVYWGDIGLTDAMLLLLKEVLNSGINYDFISFKTGQDLVINEEINTFLLKNKNKIFMDARLIPKNDSTHAHVAIKWPKYTKRLYDGIQFARILRTLLIRLYKKRINLLPNPYKLQENFKLYWGRTWFTIPLEVAKYIVVFVEENPWYYKIFKNSLVPDELFFQTIIMNSHFAKNVVNNNLTAVNKFKDNHPMIFTEEDIPALESTRKFFARKFDVAVDKNVVDYFVNKIIKS